MELKIKKIAVAKHFFLKTIVEVAYNEDENEVENLINFWADSFTILSELLNVDIEAEDLIHEKYHYDKIMSSYLLSSIEEDVLLPKMEETLGTELARYIQKNPETPGKIDFE